ncbi:MAG: hypothetical protein LQ343_003009 [Gyalolechia ehrenbergii]|nr:MAG: hypothetical protein LQ343_003009 [Gyalolechia ehrenbergii]
MRLSEQYGECKNAPKELQIRQHGKAIANNLPRSIRLQTTLPSHATMEGTLFTACPITNLVAITTTTPTSLNTPPTYHILPISSIQNFTLLAVPPASNGFASPPNTAPALGNVPTAALLARADAAVARLKEAASRRNKNVGKEAQDLFDGISRTLPTRWDGNNIVVMDSVDNERKRFVDRERKVVVPAVPAIPAVHTGPRKGG